MYVLPNRKEFSDAITRIFIKKNYRKEKDDEDESVDLCTKSSSGNRELFPYQKLIRDYLLVETPYRGILVYHGLGSGKTCSAIAVAESLLSKKKIYVLAKSSLLTNFKQQLRSCGDSIYQQENHWVIHNLNSESDREKGKGLGISDKFLDKKGRFFMTIPEKPSNYSSMDLKTQKDISEQIDDILEQRYEYIPMDGIRSSNIEKYLPENDPNNFDDSVIIIDEAHNFAGTALKQGILRPMYDRMYRSKNTKIVLLSGTPVINNPLEIAILLNLIRGPIERVRIGCSSVISWDEGMMTSFLKTLKDVDTIEYDSVKRQILLTRNPPHFETILSEKGERIAVKYNKDFIQEPDILKWVDTFRTKFQEKIAGVELLTQDKLIKEDLECLPSNFEEFAQTFIDGLQIKNALLFQRRIQGLVSYYKGADERLVAKEINQDKRLVKVPMSSEQFLRYLEKRWIEIQMDTKKGRSKSDMNEDFSSYRTNSRLVCNFALPPELEVHEEGEDFKEKAYEKIRSDPKRFLIDDKLKNFAPKMYECLQNIKKYIEKKHKQFIYSTFTGLEGTGMFGLVLEQNGFQKYKLKKENGIIIEDPDLKPGVPAYAFFTGEESQDDRDLYRQIFNNPLKYSDDFPQTLKESIKEPDRLCILMASKAGAEGINLENVREVHILESQWNPAIVDQVIGRAIRICSHARLPLEERTVEVKIYVSVFSKEQSVGIEGPNIALIRRNDTDLKRYDVEQATEVFLTTDEYMYDLSYRKGRIAKNISLLLKQSAIDCEIHRKLHSKEQPVIQCMRFDTTTKSEDLAWTPSLKSEERDTLYLKNIVRKSRRLQRVSIKGLLLIIDPDTQEVFDAQAFEDKRLLKIGMKKSPTEIQFF
jgi:SNF2 family DNA or RNA helicase